MFVETILHLMHDGQKGHYDKQRSLSTNKSGHLLINALRQRHEP